VRLAANALFWHAVTVGILICRRHFPTWKTMGMFVPLGALVRVKLPSVPDKAAAMGSPDGVAHLSQLGPWVIGSSVLLGM